MKQVLVSVLHGGKPRLERSGQTGSARVQAFQHGRRHPKRRNRDLQKRGLLALLPGPQIRWMKAH
eukprot:1907591-Amphidinium_carterae.2